MPKWILGCLLVCGMACSATYADTIGPNCATCGGVVYTLTSAPGSAPMNGTQWYDFTLTVNTSGINVGTAQVLTAVALKDPSATGAQLLGSPAVGGWTMVSGGTSASGGLTGGGGCKVNTSNGFDCAQATATTGTNQAYGVPTGSGDTYTFVFGFLLPAGSSGDLSSGLSLKALYDTKSGSFGGLQTSETFAAPVPEPASLALLASGLLAIGMLLKRR